MGPFTAPLGEDVGPSGTTKRSFPAGDEQRPRPLASASPRLVSLPSSPRGPQHPYSGIASASPWSLPSPDLSTSLFCPLLPSERMLGSYSIPPLSCETCSLWLAAVTLTGDKQVGDVQPAGFWARAPLRAVDGVLGRFWLQVDWCLNRHPQGRVDTATSVSLSLFQCFLSLLFPSPLVLTPTLPCVSSWRLPLRSPFSQLPPSPQYFSVLCSQLQLAGGHLVVTPFLCFLSESLSFCRWYMLNFKVNFKGSMFYVVLSVQPRLRISAGHRPST